MRRTLCRISLVFFGLVIACNLPVPANACVRIFWNTNKLAKVVGRTLDLFTSDQANLVFYPRGIKRDGHAGETSAWWSSKHANLVVTAFDAGTSDGMNEHGLAAHVLYLHDTKYEPRDQRPGLSNALWAQYVLDNFKTVAEALEGLRKIQVVSAKIGPREWPLHLAIEDDSGDSAVLEYIDGKLVVHHGRQYAVMSNEPSYDKQLENLKRYKLFGGNLPLPGDIDPMDRFVRAASFLKTLPEPLDEQEAMAGIVAITRNAMNPPGATDTSGNERVDAWPTRWMTAADLTHRVFYFNSTKSPNLYWVDMKKLDPSPGSPVLALDPYDSSLVGEVSRHLRKQESGPK